MELEERKEEAVRERALDAGVLAGTGTGAWPREVSPSSLSRSVDMDATDRDTVDVEKTGPGANRSQCCRGEGK